MKNNELLECIAKILFVAVFSISTAAAAFAQPDTISGGVLNGKAVKLSIPPYPAAARAVRASGAVNVQVTIDETGKVISAAAVSGHPLLRASAVSAASSSTFAPTLLSGNPVKVTGIIVYNFSPGTPETSETNTTNGENTNSENSTNPAESETPLKRTSKDPLTGEEIIEYQIGDSVEVFYAGDWNPGKIIKKEGSGKSIFAEVEYAFQGEQRNAKFFYNALRLAPADSKTANKNIPKSSGKNFTVGEYGCSSKVRNGSNWVFTPRGSFKLMANGKYTQTSGGGSYKYNAEDKAITFSGGFFGNSKAKGNVVSGEQIDIEFAESNWWTCALQK